MILEEVIAKNAANTDRIMQNATAYLITDNTTGVAIKSTFDNMTSVGINNKICGDLVPAARSAMRDLDPSDDLAFLRIATRQYEYLIAAEKEFTIVVTK